MVVGVVKCNGGCLSSSAMGIQNAYAVRLLFVTPVSHKDVPAVLERACNLHQPAIYQQLRSWLDILARDADDGLPIGMRGQNNLSAHQVRDGITQAPQFVSRQQAFG